MAAPGNLTEKRHFPVLDGLRGVAALMVVIFHTFEAYANDNRFTQIVNHGYLAVDFFFLLSGFVIAYAYDDRWTTMTQLQFYKRRVIRLQPMVVMGSLLGAALFYLQKAPMFPLVAVTPVWKMLIVMVVGCTLLPLLPSMDIRGWQEMHPLDGPTWSLFFEYIANVLYASGIRKLSNRALMIVVLLAASLFVQVAVLGPRGDVVGGWTVDRTQLHIGFARLLFPFFAGMLLMRAGMRVEIRWAFPICSLLIVAALVCPRVGGPAHLWQNGLYESFCVLLLFPLIVAMGAGHHAFSRVSDGFCKFLGEMSFPLYMTHYPLIYIYTAWVTKNHVPPSLGAPVGLLLVIVSLGLAYLCLNFYDLPIRSWLARHYLTEVV